ncbi:AI-2E family transporter [Neorhodopirellula pilleata]|uniref:AI-2 transport protein TqsA n=1 Tax=Neorhodopirellula pilleata TaxID=2714738 RepID=A0A5C6AQL4_9BACT|nr:AI-2E family transporter [Neorhodopirellula pilleata]TWU02010.1 AI-2 transport protein TqsA [Neorhodopirellula pilleata]
MAKPRSDLATIAGVAQWFAVVLTVISLYLARDVFIPLALGLLLSFLLSPIVDRLHRLGIPNVAAVVMTATFAFLLLAGGFTLLGRELTSLVADLPQHKGELITKARSVAGMTSGVGGSLDELADEMTEAMESVAEKEITNQPKPTFFERITDQVFPAADTDKDRSPNDGTSLRGPLYVQVVKDDLPLASWASSAGTILGPFATAGLVSVFALFMLIHREDLRDRIIAVVSHGDYVTTTEALDEAAGRISRYLMAQTIVNTSYGAVLTIGLMSIGAAMTQAGGFPNAILWGVLATCLRFIPYLGPISAAAFPLTIALSVFPGYGVALAVFGLIITMELLSNNVLEPWLYGASTGISAVAVILAAVFWGWLWGPVGLLLSTPLTVCLVVLGRYVPRFKILSTLFAETIEVRTAMRFYQRLLANDEHRAWEFLRETADQSDFAQTCDEVLIPTLKRVRTDHDAEYLTDADANRLLAMIGGQSAKLREHLLKDVEPQITESAAEVIQDDQEGNQEINQDGADMLPLIVGCSSHHFSEMLVLNLLRTGGTGVINEDENYRLQSVDDETLPEEIGQQVLSEPPAMVVIVVLPPGGFAQSRYLCKRLRSMGYAGPIVVSCLGKFKHFDQLFVKFRKVGATSMTTSFSQTQAKIHSIMKQQRIAREHVPLRI